MLQKIRSLINKNQSIVIATHSSPDGDAIGSSLALSEVLNSLGKDVYLYCVDDVPYFLRFLKRSDRFINNIKKIKNKDLLIVLDCAEYHRLGADIKPNINPKHTINIDHHISNTSFGDVNYIDTNACAVGEMILKLVDLLNFQLTPTVAEALYVSILTDTGAFKYSGTTPESLEAASRLVKAGALPWKIASELYENNPPEKLHLLVEVLSSLYVDKSGTFATISITQDILKKYNANSEMTDGFVNYPRSIKGVEVAVLFRELEGKVKLSVRSVGNYNVSEFCSRYGGGGHVNAAGCYVNGSLKGVMDSVIKDMQKWVKTQKI